MEISICECKLDRKKTLRFMVFIDHKRTIDHNKVDQNASKAVAWHFNLPNHSNQHMVVCGLCLHQGSTESRKPLEQKFIFQIGTLNPNGINGRFSFN